MSNNLTLMTFNFTDKLGLEKTFELANKGNLKYIDIFSIKEKEVDKHLELIKKYNVNIKCYIAFISFFKKEAKYIKELEKDLSNASKLGATVFMIVPYSKPKDDIKLRLKSKTYVHKHLIKGFKDAVELAKKYDLKVCFETTPQKFMYLSSVNDCKYVLDNVSGLGYVLDTANSLTSGEDPFLHVEQLKDYISHVHLKDVSLTKPKKIKILLHEYTSDGKEMNFARWGTGVVPIKDLYNQIISNGYQGYFAIEFAPIKSNDLDSHLEELNKYTSYLD
ncbi:MAG: sugar phosphate isomerase/epimerase [Bacilli bacterium]|nr:sugar phosphate isomerase/epimerase [Bacilli bacterium]